MKKSEYTGTKFARRCDDTGKGMNAGWVFNDGEHYSSTEEGARAYVATKTNEDGSPCDFDTEMALIGTKDEWGFYTEWEDDYEDEWYTEDGISSEDMED